MIWSRCNWLKDAILPLLVGLLRVLWLAPWLDLLRRWTMPSASAPILSAPLMLAVYLGSAALARPLAAARRLRLARLAEALAGLGAILFVLWLRLYADQYLPWQAQWLRDMAAVIRQTENEFPLSVVVIPVVVYLWLRGILDGQAAPYRDDVWNAFAGGFVGLVLAALAAPLDGRGLPIGMSSLAFAYFAVGMAALALSSLETEQRLAERGGEGRLALNRYWLASMVSVIAVLLGLALLFSALITPELIARALWWLSIVLDLVGRVLYYVLLVVAYVVFLLLEPLLRLVQNALRSETPPEPMQAPDFERQLADLPKGTATLPPAVSALLPWLGLAALVVALGLIFALALQRLRRDDQEHIDETREIILSRDLLSQQLSQLLRGLRRRGQRDGSAHLPSFLSLGSEIDTRRVIRQVYQMLLAAMIERGCPRQRGQTPAEYRRDVEAAIPAAHEALATVTDAYQQARYSAQPPDTGRARAALEAWEDIRSTLEGDSASNQDQREGRPAS